MRFRIGLGFLVLLSLCFTVKSECIRSCDLALASYFVWSGSNLSFIARVMETSGLTIASYNKNVVPNRDSIQVGTRVNIPFSCECVNGNFLGYMFEYDVNSGDTYHTVAEIYFSNLTTVEAMEWFNSYSPTNIPESQLLNVSVNCSCGNSAVSEDYGLFITYPLRPGETLASIAQNVQLDETLLQRPLHVNHPPAPAFSSSSGGNKSQIQLALKFALKIENPNGSYRPLKSSSKGLAGGAIAGIIVAAIAGVLLMAGVSCFGFYRKNWRYKPEESNGAARVPTGIKVHKSVEYSYEELARATDNFSLANKIGQGGFGAVYYAELRGEKAAIKKMDTQASEEFLAELNVLTRVHHSNLVRLIGYCVEGSLFLVYEYIENGNLSQHLRGSGRDPLPWSNRVQIALDLARGLECIHEHTVPVYIHRDIKSANILIDKNFHAKVAGFGLAKLIEVGSTSFPTRIVGTFGYMPPEYAQCGEVSPKVDVYAFGVVIYELISAKQAVVRADSSDSESRGLVGLFEEVLNQPDPKDLWKLVDPGLETTIHLTQFARWLNLPEHVRVRTKNCVQVCNLLWSP
ncbi:chitin elicitor receptor kinase 1 isoform X1 [Prunus yedoensis var. nudiflora]|uniref:non-specific serine/threonine protein kinase n=1 Tax=Prunus yedoensis var. nudiflora TaxID=2094558 RepID=A0A314YEL4_PRUYE|nr:chitin elicitor receptor kinase 1 isoform X1 [Prunus yedoensis var. nudiflora]